METLRDIRRETGKGLNETLALMQQYDRDAPTTTMALVMMELRGGGKVGTLAAYAHALQVPIDRVIAAAKNSKTLASPPYRYRKKNPVKSITKRHISP